MKRIGVYLPQPVFPQAQLYVASSRMTLRRYFKILIVDDEAQDLCITSNVVYK